MEQRLRTPEEVAEGLTNISPYTIRNLCRQGKINFIPLARGKVVMTDEQVDGMLAYMERPAGDRPRRTDSVFGSTGKSKTTRRRP